MLRVMVRYSNHEVLAGSVNHHECSYEPRGDTRAIRVTSVQNRKCLDYFCRIGVSTKVGQIWMRQLVLINSFKEQEKDLGYLSKYHPMVEDGSCSLLSSRVGSGFVLFDSIRR